MVSGLFDKIHLRRLKNRFSRKVICSYELVLHKLHLSLPEKNVASQIEAKVKEREFLLKLAKLKAEEEGTGSYKEYEKITLNEGYSGYALACAGSFFAGIVSAIFMSKL